MPDEYKGRKRTQHQPLPTKRSSPRMKGLLSLLLKQTSAVLLCGLLLWGMHESESPVLSRCSRAFGRALRHESAWSALSTDALQNFIESRFSQGQQDPLADSNAAPEITEH